MFNFYIHIFSLKYFIEMHGVGAKTIGIYIDSVLLELAGKKND